MITVRAKTFRNFIGKKIIARKNELRKLCETILRRLDKDDEQGVCNACYAHKAVLLGVYNTFEDADRSCRALPIEDDDYKAPQ